MKKVIHSIVLFLLVVHTAGTAALARTQITTGVIQGTVIDETGAVVVGADVEARNPETNFAKALTTDSDGRFVFLQLQPGRYSLTISKQGFATLIQENLDLTVGQAISLNLKMKVSQLEERITISAAPTVDTVKTESSTTLNELSVSTTPILGRKFEDLLTLTPGVSIVQGPDGDEITFSGQRGIFNNISLDGGDYNNGFFGEQVGGQRAAIDITLEAVKEFQVVATGASAEFGRTAGGIVNVVTKSGTNAWHGSLFHFQRLEQLTADTSDGQRLTDFHREQFGGTAGGPIVQDKMFFFGAFEQIFENLTRANLSVPIGDPCPVSAPTVQGNEALINSSSDCQRVALLNFFQTNLGQEEGNPVEHPIRNSAALLKYDWNVSPANKLGLSYNFTYSRNENQTFDVATYGNSANGIEGPTKINVVNLNLFSTISPTTLNEAHFTYSRENRPRSAVDSNVPADTAMGFVTTFRFGNPFFLQPNVDEIFWRTQIKDNFSIISGRHTFKMGGDWIHSLNDQVFRGFFTARYIFDSVTGFLRYASPAAAGGFGPRTVGCSNGSFVTLPASCPAGTTTTGGPLLLYLQGAGRTGLATDETGASKIDNEEFALFIQDKWQIVPNFTLSYGLRWEAQVFPDPVVPPSETAYGQFLGDPRFPSDGTLPSQWKMFQPRLGFAWDVASNSKSVLRAHAGIFNARQNMLSQVGSITTNGVQQQTIFVSTDNIRLFGADAPVWPGLVTPPALPPGTFPLFSGVRVFSSDYANPRIYTANVAFEQELYPNLALYLDYTHSKGVHLTRFININRTDFFSPQLGEVMVTTSRGKGLYRGFTIGMRKRFSDGFQLETNYVLSKDLDDDSNERDPFTDRSFDINNLSLDYALSDRDIRHKFNFLIYSELPGGFQANARIQARSAQPITPGARTATNRNIERKDNEFFSFDWRLMRPFRFGEGYSVVPVFEMFNTFNNANNINPLVTPGLFNFDGFLRQGVGDPLQVQLAVRFTF
ncbi:MAG: carboxypeptidase regulatory-like domain-containing protein [Blastocatellia bacterium]|nr:carboxypeptidase regulatory-like domain-containing protein [Blastocatellia bacterium]